MDLGHRISPERKSIRGYLTVDVLSVNNERRYACVQRSVGFQFINGGPDGVL